MSISIGVLLPFVGTALGAACVFVMREKMGERLQKALIGFASGVMVAASIWSLLIPAMEYSGHLGRLAFAPAACGLLLGMAFLLMLDRLVPHLHCGCDEPEGPRSALGRSAMMVLAVTLHNIPEGMAVGVMLAGTLAGGGVTTLAGALTLSLGIAIQNFPEGAIISMPLRSEGMSSAKAFALGALSGVVEPLAAIATMVLAAWLTPVLPVTLSHEQAPAAPLRLPRRIHNNGQSSRPEASRKPPFCENSRISGVIFRMTLLMCSSSSAVNPAASRHSCAGRA